MASSTPLHPHLTDYCTASSCSCHLLPFTPSFVLFRTCPHFTRWTPPVHRMYKYNLFYCLRAITPAPPHRNHPFSHPFQSPPRCPLPSPMQPSPYPRDCPRILCRAPRPLRRLPFAIFRINIHHPAKPPPQSTLSPSSLDSVTSRFPTPGSRTLVPCCTVLYTTACRML